MPIANTTHSYGSLAKIFHWLTALLILSAIPLGLVAENMAFATSEELAAKAWVFSLHKTVGVTAFIVALLRIGWAFMQPKPMPLHPKRRLETFAAETVHWALYISLVLVPLSGWLHHAAAEGFAPILWPFGQSLPFVPKSPDLADLLGAFHWLFSKVLIASILLHIAGALKHVIIDRDHTLRRMWFGYEDITTPTSHHSLIPALCATALWAFVIAAGYTLAQKDNGNEISQLADVESDWQVTRGDLTFSVAQMGASVEGQFADWAAAIEFDPDTGIGSVKTDISIPSLTLGSVTNQALGADFFDAENHPTAVFEAEISPNETHYNAIGTLTLKGVSVPVSMPFSLEFEGNVATMQGEVALDRRDFGMGENYSDESQVGFAVIVTVDLTAER